MPQVNEQVPFQSRDLSAKFLSCVVFVCHGSLDDLKKLEKALTEKRLAQYYRSLVDEGYDSLQRLSRGDRSQFVKELRQTNCVCE